jgi:hypothetical protein
MRRHFLVRFNQYQWERFPFLVLIFTTFSVVASSFVIVLPRTVSLLDQRVAMLVGTITGVLFLFHMRVSDDHKDHFFDNRYHADRPVQKKIVSLKEIAWLDRAGIVFQALLNAALFPIALLWWLLAYAYSSVAGGDFFLGASIRERFYLYNLLNMLQLLFVQAYLYALIDPAFSAVNILFVIHFLFVLLNAAVLEFARKMKHPAQESAGNDTYSARLGVRGAAAAYGALCLLVYSSFLFLLQRLSASPILLVCSFAAVAIVTVSIILYLFWADRRCARIVEGSAVAFYLSMHLLLAATRL